MRSKIGEKIFRSDIGVSAFCGRIEAEKEGGVLKEAWIKVLSPPDLVEEMKASVWDMMKQYEGEE